MTAVAFLFPGQGARRVGEALRAACRAQRLPPLCALAALAASAPPDRLLRSPSLLDRTEILQPVLTGLALTIARALQDAGVAPAAVLGHSLGEIAAWSAAGGIEPEHAVELAALRGRLMAREAAKHPGGMVALATDDPARIDDALAVGRRAGVLCVAAYNAPDETVLSGEEAAIRAVLASWPGQSTRVPTSGAWHSPLMAGALGEWGAALGGTPSAAPRCPVVVNRHGSAVTIDLPPLLAEQLVRPVHLTRSLLTLSGLVSAAVTIGPGAVLRALLRRNAPSIERGAGGPGEERPVLDQRAPRDEPTHHPIKKITLFATDDERSLNETITSLRAAQ